MDKQRLQEIRRRTREQRRKRERNIAFAIMLLAVAVIFALVMASGNAQAEDTYIVVPVEVIEQPEVEPVAYEVEAPETNENELIERALLENAIKIENVTMTHYCICKKCCGKSPDNPAYGITASGRKATPYVSVAVDPDVIPLGADVLVDYGDGEIHYMRADDVGGSIKGNHIDVCVKDHETAINEGIKTATVYWISPEAIE